MKRPVKLTNAELKVLKLVVEDINSEEIADKLGLSVHTINNHRKSIIRKTNSNSIVGAIVRSIKTGELSIVTG